MTPESLAYRLHKWCGLLLGIVLAWQATTGLVLVFRAELNHLLYTGATTAATSIDPMDAALERVLTELPGLRPDRLFPPESAGAPVVVWLRSPGDGDLHIAMFDTATGKLRHHGSVWVYPVEAVFFLHYELMNGATGRWIVATFGLVLLVMVVTGLMRWWPRARFRDALRIRWHQPRAIVLFDLHRVPAAAASLIVLVLAFSGTALAIRPSVIAATAPVHEPVAANSDCRPVASGGLAPSALVRAARAAFPEAPVRVVQLESPDSRTASVVFRDLANAQPRAVHAVYVDRCSGEIARVLRADARPALDRALNWMLPLHSGEIGGLAGRLAVLVSGLILLVTVCVGFCLFTERRRLRVERRIRSAAAVRT